MKVSNKVTENGRVTAKLVLNLKKRKKKNLPCTKANILQKNYLFVVHELQCSYSTVIEFTLIMYFKQFDHKEHS